MFQQKTAKEILLKLKKIKVNGMLFTIKAINPLLDFSADKIPQIFTDFISIRKSDPHIISPEYIKKMQQDMHATIYAGVVEPKLSQNGSKDGNITPEDLFRDPSMGVKLYHEIVNHSLNKFRGLNKLFFSIGIKLSMLMLYASGMVKDLAHSSSKKENLA